MSAFFARLCTRVLGMSTELRPIVNRYTASDHTADEHISPRRATTSATLDNIDSHGARLPQNVRHLPPVESASNVRQNVARDTLRTHERAVNTATVEERTLNRPRRAALEHPERENETPKPETPPDGRRLMPLASIARREMRQSVVFATKPQQKEEKSSTVHVHIGRIDVRAVSAVLEKKPPSRTTMRLPSLEAHLRARDRGSG